MAMQTLVFLVTEFPIWALVSAAVLVVVVLGAPIAAIVLWVTRRSGAVTRTGQLRIVRVRQTRVYGARRRAPTQRQREAS